MRGVLGECRLMYVLLDVCSCGVGGVGDSGCLCEWYL